MDDLHNLSQLKKFSGSFQYYLSSMSFVRFHCDHEVQKTPKNMSEFPKLNKIRIGTISIDFV